MFTQNSRPAPSTPSPSPHLVESQAARLALRNYGLLPLCGVRTSNQSQYEFSHRFSGLIRSISLSQFSNSRTSLSFPFSHISPELIGHYARFRVQDELAVYDDHRRRVRVLRWLSMTCRTMRLRFLPWIWERLDVKMPKPYNWSSGESVEWRLNSVINALHTNIYGR